MIGLNRILLCVESNIQIIKTQKKSTMQIHVFTMYLEISVDMLFILARNMICVAKKYNKQKLHPLVSLYYFLLQYYVHFFIFPASGPYEYVIITC